MTTPAQIKIESISFDPDGDIQVTYLVPQTDAKAAGLAQLHTLFIPNGNDYDDEIAAVHAAAAHLVADVLDDWDTLEGAPEAP